jgi:hypothetical protein
MIDPGRKRQNDQRAAALVDLQRQLIAEAANASSFQAMSEKVAPLAAAMARHVPLPQREMLSAPIPTDGAFALGSDIIRRSLIPLRDAIRATSEPLVYAVNGQEYKLEEPREFQGIALLPMNPLPPLTAQVCLELAKTILELATIVHDPVAYSPLAIERGHYARERTKLLEIEHRLWQLTARSGGPSDRLPYANRFILTTLTWHPDAYRPPGAWTLCIRCGELLHRKRPSLQPLARCAACMKETEKQRRWPEHAIAPHARGTWFLRCQHPDCEAIFEGPRHRKLCDIHTSSKLPPKQRLGPTRAERGSNPE